MQDKVNPYVLAVDEAALAAADGRKGDYEVIARTVTETVADRSQFARDVSVRDAERLTEEINRR